MLFFFIGVILNRSYVQPLCSPTRSTFMSGRFPIHTGLQHSVVRPNQPYGLPLNITTIADHLKTAGYATHIVGKWHLGFCNLSYTPLHRGFDSHFGYYVGAEDYYTHRRDDGLDFRRNTAVVSNMTGVYSTYAFSAEAERIVSEHDSSQPLYLYLPFQAVHEPLEAPQRFVDMYAHVKDKKRRVFSAMVTAMDEAIGNVTNALKNRSMWNDTLMVFTTDNGGPVTVGANNYPLRGSKHTVWEGGTRGSAFIHGTMLQKTGYVNNGMIHSVDWYPTLLAAADIKTDVGNIDGMNVWSTVSTGAPSPRQTFVYNIDTNIPVAAIRFEKWKLITGEPGTPSGWIPPANASYGVGVSAAKGTYLFDLDADPTEHFNLAESNPEALAMMKSRLAEIMKTYVHDLSTLHPPTSKADPKNFNGTWSPGWC